MAEGAIVLAAGAVPALLTVFCLPAARLFLDGHRAEAEVRQHAETLFRSHRLDRTRARVGTLLLLSLFERRACLLPDAAIRDRVSDAELADVMRAASPKRPRATRSAAALLSGLDALEALLADKGFRGHVGPDEIVRHADPGIRRMTLDARARPPIFGMARAGNRRRLPRRVRGRRRSTFRF